MSKLCDLEAQLDERFEWYLSLQQTGVHYSALKRIAEIFNCLPKLAGEQQKRWIERVSREMLLHDVVKATEDGIENDAQRIRRILSFGTKWNSDELLLVVQLKIEIEMVIALLNHYSQTVVSIASYKDIDEDIVEIANSKENARAFDMAVSLMRRNWGLPLSSRWLGL